MFIFNHISLYLPDHQAATDLYQDKVTESASKGQWNRALPVYQEIIAFEQFAGHGVDREQLDLVKVEWHEKQKQAERWEQLEFAKAALALEGVSDEVKAAANATILRMLLG